MKKTILAIAIPALFASAAHATNIYDKSGSTVDITGNLRSQWIGNNDDDVSDLNGRARVGFSAKTAITDTWSAIAKGEWQYTAQKSTEVKSSTVADVKDKNGNVIGRKTKGNEITSREVYVGLDGSQFGKIRFGQMDTVYNDVINKADIANEFSGQASGYDGRQEGQVRYDGSWSGVVVGGSYYTSNSSYDADSNWGTNYKGDVDHGYAAKVGYDAPFGLSVVIGGERKDFNATTSKTASDVETKKDGAFGVSYTLNGLYLGAQYNKTTTTSFAGDETKYRGYELAASYTIDAWTPYVVYDNSKEKDAAYLSTYTTLGLSYAFTSNFNAYGEYVVDNTAADDKYLLGLLYAF